MNKIIIFDFDGTLTPYSAPQYQILKDIGLDDDTIINRLQSMISYKDNMYEAFCKLIIDELTKHNIDITDDNLCLGSDKVEYNNGVEEFLSMLKEKGYKLYIISSGLEIYLRNTIIAKYFDGIYGTTLEYSDNRVIGVKRIVTDETKIELIKAILAINYVINDDCHDVTYLGDGYTDYYAMKFIKEHGGTSLFIASSEDGKEIYNTLAKEDVVDTSYLNDFTSKGEIFKYFLD